MSKARNFKKGRYYHIFQRGSKKDLIFLDSYDYAAFLKRLRFLQGEVNNTILQYCLMPNHYHLLVKAFSETSITKLMHRLNTYHSKRFCSKYNSVGSVFQGRYGAKLMPSTEVLLTCSRYIHRNPIEIVGSPDFLSDYTWSSLGHYLGERRLKSSPVLFKKVIMKHFENENEYRDFLLCSDREAQEWARRAVLKSQVF